MKRKFSMKNIVLTALLYLAAGFIFGFGFLIAVGVEWLWIRIVWWLSLAYVILFCMANDRDTHILRVLIYGDEEE